MTSLRATFADAMGRADGCETCGNHQPPDTAIPYRGGWITDYKCPLDGTTWTLTWKE